jgi:hypothetical protein
VTRPSLRLLVLFLALVVILLCGATSQPDYLQGTQLLPTFRVTFTNHLEKEVRPPDPTKRNEFSYLTIGDTVYFKSFFWQSALIPGEPFAFKNQKTSWYIERDPQYNNQYTARVYCETCTPQSYALVAVNLGPPRPDLVARFNATLDLPPLPMPRPSSRLPVTPPPNTAIQWFLTAGHTVCEDKVCLPPGKDQGYFAMYESKGVTSGSVFYKQPYSLAGGGAGAWHQAYGQLVYDTYEIPAKLEPEVFTPPSGYTLVVTPQIPGGGSLVKSNCSICHFTESGPTTLYGPTSPTLPSGKS